MNSVEHNGVDGGSLFNVINDARVEQAKAKLDLAVQRAQELADEYDRYTLYAHPSGTIETFGELLALFRAAR